MRRMIGLLALVSILATPAVARVRLFCRFTGFEITDCDEQRVPERPVVQQANCCDRRVIPAAAPAAASRESVVVLAAGVAISPAPPLLRLAPRLRPRAAPKGAGPPLFIQQRALLL